MKQLKIEGFSSDLTPTDKPAVSVFGEEGSGKTRFAATMPDGDGDGAIGLLALDRKARRTFKKTAEEMDKRVIANSSDYLSPTEAREMALADCDDKASLTKVKKKYGEVYKRILDDAMKLAAHDQIASIVVDSNTQFWDWIMFSHFGRRNQVESYQRGAPNQDMIDFINALKNKNLCLLHRAAEVWKDTGETDKQGRKKQAPSGKFRAETCSKIGYLITCELEMVTVLKAEDLDSKFHVKVRECQNNPLIEGKDLHDSHEISGNNITWDNVMIAIEWS
jgi:hypothetical protein